VDQWIFCGRWPRHFLPSAGDATSLHPASCCCFRDACHLSNARVRENSGGLYSSAAACAPRGVALVGVWSGTRGRENRMSLSESLRARSSAHPGGLVRIRAARQFPSGKSRRSASYASPTVHDLVAFIHGQVCQFDQLGDEWLTRRLRILLPRAGHACGRTLQAWSPQALRRPRPMVRSCPKGFASALRPRRKLNGGDTESIHLIRGAEEKDAGEKSPPRSTASQHHALAQREILDFSSYISQHALM